MEAAFDTITLLAPDTPSPNQQHPQYLDETASAHLILAMRVNTLWRYIIGALRKTWQEWRANSALS